MHIIIDSLNKKKGMLMKKLIPVAVIILCSFLQAINAQSYNTIPGFIVMNNNDTIPGFFKDRGSIKNKIVFKASNEKDFKDLTPSEVSWVSFTKGKNFKACSLPGDLLNSEKVFLQVLVQGYMSLYYADNEYYLVEKGNAKYILDKKEDNIKRIDDGGGHDVRNIVVEDKRYQGLMIFLVGDCSKMTNKLTDLAYTPSDLSKTVSEYNRCKSPAITTKAKSQNNRKILSLGLKFDYLINDMDNFISTGRYYKDNFTKEPCLSGGVFASFAFTRKLSLQTEVLLTQRKSSLYSENINNLPPEIIKWNMTFLELPVLIYYSFPLKTIQPHVFAGGLIGTKVSDKSEIQTIYSFVDKMELMELGYRAGAGLNLNIAGMPKLRLEYYYEMTRTNIPYNMMSYHQLANNFSVSVIF
jgi:hypothetical protein